MRILSLRLLVEALVAVATSLVLFTFGWSVAAEAMLRFAANARRKQGH